MKFPAFKIRKESLGLWQLHGVRVLLRLATYVYLAQAVYSMISDRMSPSIYVVPLAFYGFALASTFLNRRHLSLLFTVLAIFALSLECSIFGTQLLDQWLSPVARLGAHLLLSLMLLLYVGHLVRKQYLVDAVTGLPGMEALKWNIRSIRSGSALAIVDIDVNRIERSNLGGANARDVVRYVGVQLVSFSKGAEVYRIGPQKFALVAKNGDDLELAQRLEVFRERVQAKEFGLRRGVRRVRKLRDKSPHTIEIVPLSVTVGVAGGKRYCRNYSVKSLFQAATRALYHAKTAGSNCVMTEPLEPNMPRANYVSHS